MDTNTDHITPSLECACIIIRCNSGVGRSFYEGLHVDY